ncbi:hypothetical protein [Dyella solisilvae]|nr:hypothetical protein [Dyella solisilvae]
MAMTIFGGWFIWGLILAGPLYWLGWRLRVKYWLPRLRSLWRRRTVQLPSQLVPLVLLGKRRGGGEGKRA